MKGSIFQCSTNTENVNKFLMYELLSSFKKKQKQKKQKTATTSYKPSGARIPVSSNWGLLKRAAKDKKA